jgi:putative SOS response-associated peptidase YedK
LQKSGLSLLGTAPQPRCLGPGAQYGAIIVNPQADGEFEVFPVSKAVNSPKNDSPELVNRVAL